MLLNRIISERWNDEDVGNPGGQVRGRIEDYRLTFGILNLLHLLQI